MTLPAELKEREDRLKADEVNWEAKRKQLERIILKHNLTLDELVPKLEHLTTLISDKSVEYDQLSSRVRAITSEIALKEQQLPVINRKTETAQTTLADLDMVIANKRQQIDVGLQSYAAKRRQEYQVELKSSEEAAGRARETLELLQLEITAKRDELDDVRQEAARIRQTQSGEIAEQNHLLESLHAKRTPLEADIQGLMAELAKLQRKREMMVAETRKAKEQFDGFIDYERRARKVLETKDRELLDKEQELATEDRYIRARRSNLTGL